jgi:hypothetical protein
MNRSTALRRRHLRAPDDDGSSLVDPPFEEVPARLQSNQRHLDTIGARDICGFSLRDLRQEARSYAFQQALEYTRGYCNVWQEFDETAPWIVSGHQPQLFHPGVWFKNFVLDYLRRQYHGISVHLLIDNDVCRTTSLRVPGGPVGSPQLHAIPFDEPTAGIPYEKRRVQDFALFAAFGRRAETAIEDLIADPIIASSWARAVEAAKADPNLGQAMSKMRHQIEIDWGCCNLEMPLSLLCGARSFAVFVYAVLSRHEEFRRIYNDLLHEYRFVNGIRSRSHPVPELAEVDGWSEMPFWIWQDADPLRRPLFVRAGEQVMRLSDHVQEWTINQTSSLDTQIDCLERLSEHGIRIRPRALTTTMFARLFVADLFLHGIGGAKYDELTDAIVDRFWGFSIPEYMTLTATIRLPIQPNRHDLPAPSELRQRIRQSYYNPDRLLETTANKTDQVSNWIEAKRRAVADSSGPLDRRERHRIIAQANQALRPFVEEKRSQLEQDLERSKEQLRINSILRSREYAFCLFPAPYLRHRINGLLPGE